MRPDEQDVFFQLIVQGGGEFVYDANGNLRSSNVGQPGTDPIQGIAVPQGFATFNGFGAVVNLLSTSKGAFFQYFDNGSAVQGALILAVASASGTDPINATGYQAGLNGIDPVFGDFLVGVGGTIQLGVASFSRNGIVGVQQGGGAANPYAHIDAPEQGTARHMQMLLQGASPDASRPGQMLVGQVAGAAVLTPVSTAMVEVQAVAGSPAIECIVPAGLQDVYDLAQTGDTNARWKCRSGGEQLWGSGAATQDITLRRSAANNLQLQTADFDISTAGRGLRIAEGANAKQGTAVLVAGTVTVANTSVTANSRIDHWRQIAGGTLGHLSVGTIVAGTSFVINSSSNLDTSTIGFQIFEPG